MAAAIAPPVQDSAVLTRQPRRCRTPPSSVASSNTVVSWEKSVISLPPVDCAKVCQRPGQCKAFGAILARTHKPGARLLNATIITLGGETVGQHYTDEKFMRSEERRVGKEGRSRLSTRHSKKKKE